MPLCDICDEREADYRITVSRESDDKRDYDETVCRSCLGVRGFTISSSGHIVAVDLDDS